MKSDRQASGSAASDSGRHRVRRQKRRAPWSSISRCWPVTHTCGINIPCSCIASTSGQSLIASGRVPKMIETRLGEFFTAISNMSNDFSWKMDRLKATLLTIQGSIKSAFPTYCTTFHEKNTAPSAQNALILDSAHPVPNGKRGLPGVSEVFRVLDRNFRANCEHFCKSFWVAGLARARMRKCLRAKGFGGLRNFA